MPKIKVNGREVEAPPGQKLIAACADHGVEIPHYCWHRGLTPAGNCRMCLVKVSNSRKLEAACMVDPVEGLEVTTEGPEIDAARKSVMEYLLINHPLDCPICDKAGECRLQDYTYDYRHGVSRFGEEKVLRHIKDLGPTVKLWGTRCISCTRCVRFVDEVVGTSELSIVNRGDHSVVDVHPEVPLDNPMSLNVVDICPVGALKDREFLYKARVWFTDRKESVCASCSRGCNITATVLNEDIKRLQPRHNPEVNDYWMCDAGRRNTGFVNSEKRLKLAKGNLAELGVALRAQPIGILASTWATLEELHLIKRLADALGGAPVAFLTKTEGERWVSKSGFAIETDKTPNRRGAEALFGRVDGPEVLVDAARRGAIRGLLVINGIPDLVWPSELAAIPVIAAADIEQAPVQSGAKFVIPSACWAERDGTFMNRDGRIQRTRKLVEAPGQARPDIQWLQDLLVSLGARKSAISAEGVFREAFPGLDYRKVGDRGLSTTDATGAGPSGVSTPAQPQPGAK